MSKKRYPDEFKIEAGELSDGYHEMCDLQGEVLVADIGGSTTDLASLQMINDNFEGEMIINHGKSGTEKVEVLDAKAKLDELVRKVMEAEGVGGVTGHSVTLPGHWLDRVLTKGQVSYGGRTWDFTSEREAACRGVAERITSYIKSTVGNPNNYYKILVVGGGAIVFRPWLEKILPNAVFKDEFANAQGLLKYLRSEVQG